MKLSNLEKETIILWNEAEREAEIYTHAPALQKQLRDLCGQYPEQVRLTREALTGASPSGFPRSGCAWCRPASSLRPSERSCGG